MTAPSGRSYLVYKRCRLKEAQLLVEAQHLLGIPTWQDVSDLAPEQTEDEIRTVLADEFIANAVVLLTPEVRESPVIQRIECPLAFERHGRNDGFFIVFALAGGLSYDEANSLLRPRFGNQDLDVWNVVRVPRDPLDIGGAMDVVRVVLRERLKRIRLRARPDMPLRISLHTRSRSPFDPDKALNLEWSGHFDGRIAVSPDAWASRLLPALREVARQVHEVMHDREVAFDGLASIPAAVALGHAFCLPTGMRACWLQNMPPSGVLNPWGLHLGRTAWNCRITTARGCVAAEDIAVLISASHNTRPAFDAAQEALPRFRNVVEVASPDAGATPLSVGQAIDMAHQVVDCIRRTRDECRASGRVHLFASVPLGLAFMLGQLLNAIGPVQTYEYHPTGLVGRYEKAALLE